MSPEQRAEALRLLDHIEICAKAWHESGVSRVMAITRSCDLLRTLAAEPQGKYEPQAAPDIRERDIQLLKFYDVLNLWELVDAMERHIARLQSKLTGNDQPVFTRVREG